MNIDNMTCDELKQIVAMFATSHAPSSNVTSYAVGKYVIVRTRNEGLNFGLVAAADETGVVLSGARRIHHHDAKAQNGGAWYEALANSGPAGRTHMSQAVADKVIVEDYSLTIVADAAVDSFLNWVSHNEN